MSPEPSVPATSCPSCGALDDGASAACMRCGGSLLVDVALVRPPGSERLLFQAARSLAALGPPAPDFAASRAALARTGNVILRRVSRSFAERAIAALAAAEVAARAEPHAPPPASRSRRPLLLLALLAAAGGLALFTSGSLDGSLRSASVPRAEARQVRPAARTIQEIGKLSLPSVATVACRDSIGAGFFVEEELLITNAHVTCSGSELMQVRLADGRELSGTAVTREPWLDLARVRVVGAAAHPLPLGDPTVLVPGDPVVLIGAPRGLGFTLHDGKVSFLGRNHLGVAYVQFNASVNPGNSGGPLLNGRGEVVGIVSLKVTDAEGIGLALPISYAAPPVEGSDAARRWAAITSAVAVENQQQVDALEIGYEGPSLVALDVHPQVGPIVAVVQRWEDVPHAVDHRFEVEVGGVVACSVEVEFRSWTRLDAIEEASEVRPVQWVLKYAGGHELYVGVGALDLRGCPPSATLPGSFLRLRLGGKERGRVSLSGLPARAPARGQSR